MASISSLFESCPLLILLIHFLSSVTAWSDVINANVMGRPGSNDAPLYSAIADILLRQDPSLTEKNKTGRYGGQARSFCKLDFHPVNFDMTNGDTVYNSLVQAKRAFRNATKVAVAIGPFIEVFSSTDYVINTQIHLLTSPPGQNAGLMNQAQVVSILPEHNSMSMAIAACIKQFGWTDVALLAQDDFSPVVGLSQAGVKVWPIRLPNAVYSPADQELRRNLMELRQSEKNKFILHSTNRDVVLNVLTAAQHLHLLHPTIDWFVTYPDFEDFVQGEENWAGSLYGFQLLRQEKIPANISHLLHGNMSRLDLGLAVDVVGLLRHVLWAESADCSKERLVEDRSIPADAFKWNLHNRASLYHGALGQYTWDDKTQRRTNFTMDIVRYNGTAYKLGTVLFDVGEPTVTLDSIPDNSTKPGYVFGKDEVLRVATKQTDPFIIKRGEDIYDGFSYDLLVRLSEKLNFNFTLYEAEDYLVDASTGDVINGMVYELTTGNASMAVGALEVTAEREKLISFSYTILSSRASILIKKADSTINFFQFLGPFSTYLWLMILVFIIVSGVSLYVMSRFDPTQDGTVYRFDFKESFWYSINIVLQGSTDYSPQTTSMRAIIAFFWFCILIIEAAYTANLAAYLTLQQFDDRIKTVYDLAGQTSVKYGVERGSDIMLFFQKQKEDPYERMWAFMKLHESTAVLSNTSDIITKVKLGELAFISDGVTNDYYANQNCGIESIRQNFGRKDFSLGLPRGAPYLDDVNRAMLELKEEGEMDQLLEKWWAAGKNCSVKDDTRSIKQKATPELELTNMIGVFIVLGVFIVIAIIIDAIERNWVSRKAKQKEDKAVQMTETPDSTRRVLENYHTEYQDPIA